MASLTSLPRDLIRCIIFPMLAPSAKLALAFVNHLLYEIIRTNSARHDFAGQNQVMADVFRMGYLDLLKWLHTFLKYPLLYEATNYRYLAAAAKSML
jgi:hypothetical protein